MWWIIGLYIIPGMVSTWLFPKFVECNGGMDVINVALKDDSLPEITLQQATAIMSFLPIINIITAIILIYWYLCTQKS